MSQKAPGEAFTSAGGLFLFAPPISTSRKAAGAHTGPHTAASGLPAGPAGGLRRTNRPAGDRRTDPAPGPDARPGARIPGFCGDGGPFTELLRFPSEGPEGPAWSAATPEPAPVFACETARVPGCEDPLPAVRYGLGSGGGELTFYRRLPVSAQWERLPVSLDGAVSNCLSSGYFHKTDTGGLEPGVRRPVLIGHTEDSPWEFSIYDIAYQGGRIQVTLRETRPGGYPW